MSLHKPLMLEETCRSSLACAELVHPVVVKSHPHQSSGPKGHAHLRALEQMHRAQPALVQMPRAAAVGPQVSQ